MKKCSKCGDEKEFCKFYNKKRRNGKYSLDSCCKTCRYKNRKNWRYENREYINIKNKEYVKNNPEARKETSRKYREKNAENIKIKNNEYVLKNKEALKEKGKKYYEDNKPMIMKKAKEKINKNPHLRILKNYRKRVWEAVKNSSKSSVTMDLIGCTIEEFNKHLESQFTEGMTFENYGKWHVDHIRPCCSFNMMDPEQQKQCFHYTNCRPLWAEENLSRKKKWDGEII